MTISSVCQEAGCLCLANRFSELALGKRASQVCPQPASTCGKADNSAGMLQFVCKLGPLTQALAQAGYFDIALDTVELALNFEPTLENDLTRAYLYVILGETDTANGIYQQAIQHRGKLPTSELNRLSDLVQTHTEEEDIQDLLASLQAAPSRNQGN